MALWDKVKQELDRAGEAANAMIDEGKVRHEAFRARQLADKAAQALGYAIYRARQEGKEVDTDTYARLSSTLAGHEADVVPGIALHFFRCSNTSATGITSPYLSAMSYRLAKCGLSCLSATHSSGTMVR